MVHVVSEKLVFKTVSFLVIHYMYSYIKTYTTGDYCLE